MSSHAFAELGASRAVVSALAERGIESPFPVQQLVVPDALAGQDVLVKSPTGSGKTLAFGVPLVERIEAEDPRPTALVLVPTRELAGQIVEELRPLAAARALSIGAVYGGAGIEKQAKLARRAHILVATPGRLEDLMARRAADLSKTRILVLDEADRMLDMGFRPPVDRIVSRLPRKRQTLFFSATLDAEVHRVAQAYTNGARVHEHAAPREQRADVQHRFVSVTADSKIDALVRELRDDERGLTLVFVRTKRGADRLVKRLRTQDIEVLAMHGDKSQAQREKALARFGSGSVDTLIATDVASRGLDVDDITHVINFDAPADRDAYIHRVGRTARAGKRGVGVTFVAPDQAHDIGRIASSLSLHGEFAQSGLSTGSPANGRSSNGRSSNRRSSNGRSSNGRSSNGHAASGRSYSASPSSARRRRR
ncbi:MAG: DEAD/DEAH box helicase [Actinomycetota bacterium]|jgi:superfamily II DNA/RNA helicase|nr:DEAD/DEAH box helicase [Actinomycetota bacterium]